MVQTEHPLTYRETSRAIRGHQCLEEQERVCWLPGYPEPGKREWSQEGWIARRWAHESYFLGLLAEPARWGWQHGSAIPEPTGWGWREWLEGEWALQWRVSQENECERGSLPWHFYLLVDRWWWIGTEWRRGFSVFALLRYSRSLWLVITEKGVVLPPANVTTPPKPVW